MAETQEVSIEVNSESGLWGASWTPRRICELQPTENAKKWCPTRIVITAERTKRGLFSSEGVKLTLTAYADIGGVFGEIVVHRSETSMVSGDSLELDSLQSMVTLNA